MDKKIYSAKDLKKIFQYQSDVVNMMMDSILKPVDKFDYDLDTHDCHRGPEDGCDCDK